MGGWRKEGVYKEEEEKGGKKMGGCMEEGECALKRKEKGGKKMRGCRKEGGYTARSTKEEAERREDHGRMWGEGSGA
jgi:hypothetical protein